MKVLVTICLTDAEAAALLGERTPDILAVPSASVTETIITTERRFERDRANALGKVSAARWMAQMRNAAEAQGVISKPVIANLHHAQFSDGSLSCSGLTGVVCGADPATAKGTRLPEVVTCEQCRAASRFFYRDGIGQRWQLFEVRADTTPAFVVAARGDAVMVSVDLGQLEIQTNAERGTRNAESGAFTEGNKGNEEIKQEGAESAEGLPR